MNARDPHYPNRPEWLTRPARKQVDDATLQREIQARGGLGERNLWSGRRVGPSGPPGGDSKRGGPGGQRVKDASKYRCVLELDVGRTRGSDAKQHVFCLYFAKGCCSQGSACTYLHRLPTAEDEAYAVRDCQRTSSAGRSARRARATERAQARLSATTAPCTSTTRELARTTCPKYGSCWNPTSAPLAPSTTSTSCTTRP
ncbi:hypothetical protein Agub_g4635 [Astrephomene gubernaculifera]|uniref:C3H1-type domain-containing protein n=1 Tax=Astrephomene gubernaculifera TaxID=47775 RepID=A0AAD3DN61_9CHLO|nr:hypothetical protein Agub_g4635 [Astrephomene gubernaculifera]